MSSPTLAAHPRQEGKVDREKMSKQDIMKRITSLTGSCFRGKGKGYDAKISIKVSKRHSSKMNCISHSNDSHQGHDVLPGQLRSRGRLGPSV